MGLAERRAVQTAKDTDYKAFEEKMKGICGYDVALNFDWAAVENHAECTSICERKKYNDYMLDRVVNVFTSVCSDDMGKSAVREKLKEVKMVPTTGDLSFAGGVFTVHNDLTGQGAWGEDQIKAALEKGL